MIAVLADTHSQEGTRLRGQAADAVGSADVVLHAGDFVREPVLDAFDSTANHLYAVYGNVDEEPIRARLPRAQTITIEGFRIAMVHTVEGGSTGLEMFGRESEADLVVFGHSHRPGYRWTGEVGLLNPGSHAEPRGNRPGYAEIDIEEAKLVGTIRHPDGTVYERFEITH